MPWMLYVAVEMAWLLGLRYLLSCLVFCALQNSSVGAYTSRGFVEVLAASQSNVRKEWFQGTADAVRQYMWLFEEAMRDGVQDFLILSGALHRGVQAVKLGLLHLSGVPTQQDHSSLHLSIPS